MDIEAEFDSPIEKIMNDELERGRVYVLAEIHRQFEIGRYRIDFLLVPKHGKTRGVVLECDGQYHKDPEVVLADAERTKYLEACGFSVIRFTGSDIYQSAKNGEWRMIRAIKAKIMEGSDGYATGRTFIEMIDTQGDAYFVPSPHRL